MKNKLKAYGIVLITTFNLFFPVIGFFVNVLFYFLLKLSSRQKIVIIFNMAFSFAFLGFLYVRVNETGDVYRYALSLYNYTLSLLNGRENIIEDIYEAFYPVWYTILYIASKLNLSIQAINFLAGFTIYFSLLYIIYQLDKKYKQQKIDKLLIMKIFLFISFVAVFSSYKTLWAFSLLFLGLYFLMNNQKKGYIFVLLGIGIHPVAWIPFSIYMVSKVVKFNIIYLYISIIFGFVFKNFIGIFNNFLNIPFIGNKINTYIFGQWSQYRFHENSEYIRFFLLVLLILFIMNVIVFKYINFKNNCDNFIRKYNNFILWYFAVAMLFISFRTIELRLMLDGFIFFIPLFYQVFMYRKIYKKNILSLFLLIIWFILIDIRLFNIYNNAYQIGDGLPYNIFASPIIYILKGNI